VIKMKTWLKVLLIVLGVIVVLLVALYIWQGENIRALIKAWSSDSETLAAELEDLRTEHHEAIEEELGITLPVKPITAEQSQDLLSGKKTPEEVREEMGLPDQSEYSSTKEDIVSQCVAELYAYKADVMGYLGGLRQEAIYEWNSLSAKDKTKTKKSEIAMDGISKCYEYEAVVDGHVQEILDVYRGKLRAIGEDTGPIDILWNYYCDEKEAEKAFYFSQYLD